jgi:hypothetical protein
MSTSSTTSPLVSTTSPNSRPCSPVAALFVAPIDIGSTNLQQIVVEALQTVTQTISLVQRIDASKGPSPFMVYDYGTQGILSDPNNPAQATPGTILNYTVRLYWDGTPPCTATVTTFCVPQPHVIPFDAIFPIQGNRVRNGHCRGGARSAGHLRFLSRWRLATRPARSDAADARRLMAGGSRRSLLQQPVQRRALVQCVLVSISSLFFFSC